MAVRSAATRRAALAWPAAAAALAACGEPGTRPRPIVIGTGLVGDVYYPYGQGLATIAKEHLHLEVKPEVTSGSVENLLRLRDGAADLAFTLADTLLDAINGRGAFQDGGKVPAKALAVLYANYTHLVTLAGKGIDRIADLRQKAVSTGAPGSGTEVIALRALEAARLNPAADLRRFSLGVEESGQALRAGGVDAFFWSSGLPAEAIRALASVPGVALRLPPNDDVLWALQRKYGRQVYFGVSIPAGTYPGQAAEVPVVGVANVLVVRDTMAERLAYDLTKLLFERRDDLAAIHPEAEKLTPGSAVVGSPTPFHPGAVRYYRERGAL